MTSATQQTKQPTGWTHTQTARTVGHVIALISLLPFFIFWLDFFYVNAAEEPGLKLTGFHWFKIMGVAITLAAIAAILHSKLWRIALPISLIMFFFTMYVMGS